MPASIQIPLIHQCLDAPGSHVTEVDDLTFYVEVTRLNDNGDRLSIEVEARCTEDGSRYYAIVPKLTLLPMGLAIQADAVLMLTDAEQHAINCSTQYQDWLKEGFEADEERRQDEAERVREGRREARAMGLIRSFVVLFALFLAACSTSIPPNKTNPHATKSDQTFSFSPSK